MAEDVTIFTDDSVRCAGPIRPGPTLLEWTRTVDDETLAELTTPAVAAEIRAIAPTTFPSRLVQSAYLAWFRRHVLASAPANIDIVEHRRRAVDVRDEPDGAQAVWLEGLDEPLVADAVVLSLGHLDAGPRDGGAMIEFAAANDLVHLPAGHTADQDLSVLEPGADVIALGFGQAFTDLVALVTEGRGGRFETAADGHVTYHPSGDEPVLHVGSRRGVPYRSKLDYRLQGPKAPMPKFLDDVAVERLLASPHPLQFRRDILPLVAKEVGWAYYHELFNAHGERTTCGVGRVRRALQRGGDRRAELDALVAATVPDPVDRFSIPALDRPLAGLQFDSRRELHDHVSAHVVADVARRTNPAYSADLGAFIGLLWTFGTVGRIGASGKVAPRSRVTEIGAWWFSFFMYYASGPPPPRLRQLLALADVGLVRFIGAGTTRRGRSVRAPLRRPQHEPRRDRDGPRLRRRPHRHRVGDPHRRRHAGPAARARRGDRGGRRRRRRLVGQHGQGRRRRRQPAGAPRRVERAAPLRRRHVHEPPGRRRLRPAAHERAGLPPARRPRPRPR